MNKINLNEINVHASTRAEVNENIKELFTKVIEKIPFTVSDEELKDLFSEIVDNYNVYWKKYRVNI